MALNTEDSARILVVNDGEDIRQAICAILTLAGYRCQMFANGQDVLAFLESGEKCDLLIHDLLNAPLDGISLLDIMGQRFSDIPLVVVTALHDVSMVCECFRRGAYDYLLLPFERADLLAVVCGALDYCRLS